MAAGQVVCSFFPVVFEKLDGLIKEDHIGPFWGVKKELDQVFMDFCIIKDVLTDAEQKQFTLRAAQFWLKKLNEAAYEADDVLDDLQVTAREAAYEADDVLDELQVTAREVAIQEIGASVHKKRRKDRCEDIKRLSETFEEIAKLIEKLGLQKGNVEKRMEEICPGRETSPLPTETHPYGRDEDREKLLKLLLKDDYLLPNRIWTSRHPPAGTGIGTVHIEDITICSIVGIGGIGKTTLAQMVYNDDRAVKHFTFRSWVCVSNVFDAERIVKEIVPSSDSSEKLEDGLKKLSSTRFLLVLDDVWEENQEKWNKFKAYFRDGVIKGSSIIVTTRQQTVADITRSRTVEPLENLCCIKGLSEEDCLLLFKKYAFGPGNEERPALAEMGKEIVKKCGGLPLAVKALASLLRHKKEENQWLSIKDSAIWELPPSDENIILPALMLSYSHLPPLLKQCFVYCSIFPQDHEIDKYDLIQQWMAHSLVQPEAGKELEDVGNYIFNALLRLSFFQDEKKDEYGDIISYKMHDRMHDLATYIAGDEYAVGDEENWSRKIGKITRHVSFSCDYESFSECLEPIKRASQGLRSLIFDGIISEFTDLKFFFQYFCRLRALNFIYSSVHKIPDCFGKMIHLRYLNLADPDIRFLPKSICLLRNLQTLKLQECERLVALPNDMSKISSLRHLDIRGCPRLKSMPQLSSLRDLNCFIVSSKGEYGMSWLHKLNPGAELKIKGLEHVISSTEAKAANLVEKKNIRSLDLHWSFIEVPLDWVDFEYEEEDKFSQQQQHQSQNATEEETEDEESADEESATEDEESADEESAAEDEFSQQQQHQSQNATEEETEDEESATADEESATEDEFSQQQQHQSQNATEEETEDEDSQQQQQQHQEVIDGLQPHANLRTLLVKGYQGPNSPSWLTPSCVPNLVKISLSECRRCERLSPLGKLGSLKVLKLRDMDSLKFIVMDDDARTFRSLEELTLLDMPELEGWSSSSLMQSTLSSSSQAAIVPVFPSLKNVFVYKCPKLEGEVPLSGSPVEYVSIEGSSNGSVLGSLHDLPYLPSLKIDGHAEMENLPPVALRNLTALQKLTISNCDSLKTLPEQLKSLTTLTELTIQHCGNLVSLAEGEGGLRNLTSLKTLHIDDCNALKHLPQFHKTSLVDLAISNCLQMEFSTDDFEHLVVLEKLTLRRLPKLKFFPEGGPRNLSSLKTLEIMNCPQMEFSTDDFEHLVVLEVLILSRLPKLTCFPKGGPRNLSSLKTLHIDDCNALKHLPQFYKTSLVDLAIRNCPQMEFSTDDFEHLVVLEKLTLHRLPKLTFFPEGIKHTAETLHHLSFQHCSENGAMDLPDWISTLTSLQVLSISAPKNWKMLPQWLQDFTALQKLFIYGCDEELERRWKNKDEQRDDNCFNMISHVSVVSIRSNVWLDVYI